MKIILHRTVACNGVRLEPGEHDVIDFHARKLCALTRDGKPIAEAASASLKKATDKPSGRGPGRPKKSTTADA